MRRLDAWIWEILSLAAIVLCTGGLSWLRLGSQHHAAWLVFFGCGALGAGLYLILFIFTEWRRSRP